MELQSNDKSERFNSILSDPLNGHQKTCSAYLHKHPLLHRRQQSAFAKNIIKKSK